MEANYMKTSHSRAWECKPFIHVFLIFLITDHMGMILYIYIIFHSLGTKYTQQSASTTPTSAPST